MTQINSNIDKNYIIQGQKPMNPVNTQGLNLPYINQPQVQIPTYYRESGKKSFKDYLEESPAYSMVIKPFFGALIEHPILSFATWLGFGAVLDKYYDACSGDYNKSLLKKIADAGDRLQQSSLIQNKPVQTILGWFNKGDKKWQKTVEKNSVLRAMKYTPSMPEWPMVKTQLFNQKQEVVQDFIRIADTLHLNDEGLAKLQSIDLSKAEKEMLKKVYNVSNIHNIPPAKAVNHVLLKRLGKSQKEIDAILSNKDVTKLTKDEIIKAFGFKDKEIIKKIKEDMFGKYIPDVEQASKRVGSKVRIGLWHNDKLGIFSKPFERKLGCDNIYNRLHSMTAAKTATGRFFTKFVQMAHRGLTFGGGKGGVFLFIAPALVEAAFAMKKADNNQKIGTGISSIVESISWVFTFPIALRMMHSLGGIQNAGMSENDVANVRKIRDNFNKRNANGEFKTANAYKKAKLRAEAEMNKYMRYDKQKAPLKFLRKFVRNVLTPDLGRFNGRNTGNIITSQFTKLRNLPRNLWGVPLRFIMFIGLSSFVLDGAIQKVIKTIFGESYDVMKEEEQKDAKKEQKRFTKEDLQDRLYDTQKIKMAQFYKQQLEKQNMNITNAVHSANRNNNQVQLRGGAPHMATEESQKAYSQRNDSVDNYTYIPSQENIIPHKPNSSKQDVYTYIPSQNNVIKKKNPDTNANIRKYVPSQAAANIEKRFDNSGMQSVLDKANKAEMKALQVLAGNFEGMQN